MKKQYENPVVEKIEFDYNRQVVASGASGCTTPMPAYTQQAHEPWESQCRESWKYVK